MQNKMTNESGQADATHYRGLKLPIGVTPDLVDRLALMICDYIDEPQELPLEFAVRVCAEVLRETQAS